MNVRWGKCLKRASTTKDAASDGDVVLSNGHVSYENYESPTGSGRMADVASPDDDEPDAQRRCDRLKAIRFVEASPPNDGEGCLQEPSRDKAKNLVKVGNKSSVLIQTENGDQYIPGEGGNSAMRKERQQSLYRAHPSVRQRIEMNASAQIWSERRLLTFTEKMSDGFVARYSKELILMDKRQDMRLLEFLAYCRGVMFRLRTPAEKAAAISEAVSSALGGSISGEGSADAGKRLISHMALLIKESGKERHETMPLGDTFCGGEIFGLADTLGGAGICRHRSMLFKYACDELGVCACALVDGIMPPQFCAAFRSPKRVREVGNFDHMWNIVHIDGCNYVVDALNYPGELLSSKGLADLQVSFARIGGHAGISLRNPPTRMTDDTEDEPASDYD